MEAATVVGGGEDAVRAHTRAHRYTRSRKRLGRWDGWGRQAPGQELFCGDVFLVC